MPTILLCSLFRKCAPRIFPMISFSCLKIRAMPLLLKYGSFLKIYTVLIYGFIILPAFAIVSTMLYMFVTVPTWSFSLSP